MLRDRRRTAPAKDGGDAVLRVGLTGGIGSGKSEVARRLVAHGAVLIDADVAAREVVVPGSRGLSQIVAAFGDDVLSPDGSLNRARLGEIVFGDPELRVKLNAIVHPLVREWMDAAERTAAQAAERTAAQGSGRRGPIVVHDVPLLAESRGKGGFDLVIVVDVPPGLQVDRLVSQRGMTPDQARARMNAQASREQRLEIADIVIDNSGSLDDLDHRVAGVWAELERRAGS
jgi:dephospho-CoA kinase